MPPHNAKGAPSTARAHRPRKTRTFRSGTLDPVIEQRRPLFTWGNAMLLAIMIAFGLYATGNLPQLDIFLDSLNQNARAQNGLVVGTIIHNVFYIVFAVAVLIGAWTIFVSINSRRRVSDPKLLSSQNRPIIKTPQPPARVDIATVDPPQPATEAVMAALSAAKTQATADPNKQ